MDNSSNQYSLTINRGTPKVTPFSPFKNDDARDITVDGGSAYFDGGSHDIQWGSSGVLALGSGDWSVETWFYMENYPTAIVGNVLDWRTFGQSPANVPLLNMSQNSGTLNWYGSVSAGILLSSNIQLKRGEWTHIAVAKSGSTTTMYFNGTSVGSFTDNRNYAAQVFGMGNIQNNYPIEDCYFSDLRILIGSTAYTGSFTPPTSPLTAVTNTSLLCNFQDAGIYDLAGLSNVDTVGNAQIDTAVVKYGTGSIEFDGSGDYLDIDGSAELNFGSGDFTIEFWLNLNSSGLQAITDPRNSDSDNSPLVWINSSGKVYYYTGGSQRIVGTTVLNTGQWYHVALVKNSGTTTLYLDGTSEGSFSDSLTYIQPTTFRIGQRYAGTLYNLNGYLDDFRITKGVARYTANFTPPTQALPKF